MAEPDANLRLGHSIDTSVGGEAVRAPWLIVATICDDDRAQRCHAVGVFPW